MQDRDMNGKYLFERVLGIYLAFLAAIIAAVLFPGFHDVEAGEMSELEISSQAFSHMGMIPKVYTCDGEDVNPPLSFEGVPEGTKSFALIMDDPDAPVGLWIHWVLWNIPAEASGIQENAVPAGALQGKNSWGRDEYGGPCPPSGTHRYFFKLFALDSTLQLAAGSTKEQLEKAISGHILGKAEIIGLYRRSR